MVEVMVNDVVGVVEEVWQREGGQGAGSGEEAGGLQLQW